MGQPTPKIEIAFGVNAMTDPAPADWVDVTGFVLAVDWSRGKSTELGRAQPGSMAVALDNSGREFDPTHAGGPYFGDLVPRVHIRFTAEWDSVVYPVFRGFVQGWPSAWRVGNCDAVTSLACIDGLGLMAQIKAASIWEYEVREMGPVGWWRLGETSGEVMTDSSGNGNDGVFRRAAPEFTAGGLIVGDNDAALRLPGAEMGSVADAAPFGLVDSLRETSAPYSFACWVSLSKEGLEAGNGGNILGMGGGFFAYGFRLSAAFLYDLEIETGKTTKTSFSIEAHTVIDNGGVAGDEDRLGFAQITKSVAKGDALLGRPMLVIVSVSATETTVRFGNWWTTVGTEEPENALWPVSAGLVIGSAGEEPLLSAAASTQMGGTLDEVLFFDKALDADDRATLNRAGKKPWSGDASHERFQKILAAVGWPTSLVNPGTAGSVLGSATDTAGRSVLDILNGLTESEHGQLYAERGGKLAFRSRQMMISDARSRVSTITFSDDGTALTAAHMPGFQLDDAEILNKVLATDPDGVIHRSEDLSSQSKYGVIQKSVAVDGTAGFAADLADFLIVAYSEPAIRVEQVSPAVHNDDGWWPKALAREIGDLTTIKRTPQGVGAEWSAERVIEGVSGSVRDGGQVWEIEFKLGLGMHELAGPFFTWDGVGATEGWGTGQWFF